MHQRIRVRSQRAANEECGHIRRFKRSSCDARHVKASREPLLEGRAHQEVTSTFHPIHHCPDMCGRQWTPEPRCGEIAAIERWRFKKEFPQSKVGGGEWPGLSILSNQAANGLPLLRRENVCYRKEVIDPAQAAKRMRGRMQAGMKCGIGIGEDLRLESRCRLPGNRPLYEPRRLKYGSANLHRIVELDFRCSCSPELEMMTCDSMDTPRK